MGAEDVSQALKCLPVVLKFQVHSLCTSKIQVGTDYYNRPCLVPLYCSQPCYDKLHLKAGKVFTPAMSTRGLSTSFEFHILSSNFQPYFYLIIFKPMFSLGLCVFSSCQLLSIDVLLFLSTFACQVKQGRIFQLMRQFPLVVLFCSLSVL